MKLVRPSVRQAHAIVQAMYAVVSAAGRVAPLPIEIESVDAAQRHLLFQDSPIVGAAGALPGDLAQIVDEPALRRQTIRILAILALVDRRIMPEKVQVVHDAATALGVQEYGLTILRLASRGQFKRLAFGLMQRFVAQNWSPAGHARLRDYASFIWWMLPQLHGAKTARRNRELLTRYQALGALPPGTFGRAVHDFFVRNVIPMPGDARSVPWAMHEVYHVLSEYSVGLPAELLLTGFIGGTQEETCLDQILFGLIAYHCGHQVVGGFVTEGVLRPDEYFRAIARGAEINVNVMARDWDLFEVAAVPLQALRARYNLPPFTHAEQAVLATHNGLMKGPGFTVPEPLMQEAAE